MDEKMVEKIARAMFEGRTKNRAKILWDDTHVHTRNTWREAAQLALSCLEENGMVVVPKGEISRLQERLEMTHVWQMIDGKMARVEVEPGSIPDGIECRDETIRLQDKEIKRLLSVSPKR
ncbi:MAG: hypothetical protein K0R61_47 [Microvirga sp.]|nr:hypothetical protein [Microvirga sp.]MDF2969597.1 hypothetical protein [Microvirga sp.]